MSAYLARYLDMVGKFWSIAKQNKFNIETKPFCEQRISGGPCAGRALFQHNKHPWITKRQDDKG